MPDTRLFRLQKFSLTQEHSALKIGTDAVLLGCSVDIPEHKNERTDDKPEEQDQRTSKKISILDIGTGCGIILLMLAQKALEAGYSRIELTGIDIDSGSIADARTNAELFAQSFGFSKQYSSTGDSSNDLSYIKAAGFPACSQSSYDEKCPERTTILDIHLDCISLQDHVRTCRRQYDLIVSNPPFFINSLKSSGSGDKIAKHNDTLPQKDLAEGVGKLLAPNGSFHLILPPNEAQGFTKLCCSEQKVLNKECSAVNGNLTIKSIIAFKTTAAKPAKRLVLQFQNCSNQQTLSESQAERGNTVGMDKCTIAVENGENRELEEREMVMMRSNENGKGPATTGSKKEAFTQEYLSFVKDFLLY